MKVKVCKNCRWWHKQKGAVGMCLNTENGAEVNATFARGAVTTDTQSCSLYTFPEHADDYPSDDVRKGGGGRDDDGPVDITPRGPQGGEQLTYKGAPIYWGSQNTGYTPALIPYDPDGDKKD